MVIQRDRPWPVADSIHLISDTHFGIATMTAARKKVWSDDATYLRTVQGLRVVAHVTMGDITNDAGGAGGWTGPAPYIGVQDTEAINFYNTYFADAPWHWTDGNHDMGNDASGTLRAPDRTAQAWGFTAANRVVDLDKLRLIFICPPGLDGSGVMIPFTQAQIDWIAAQANATPKPCAVVCHWPLKDTVQDSAAAANYCTPATAIATMLAATPNLKLWLSGHTHRSLDYNIALTATYGTNTIGCIDSSAIAYTTPQGSSDFFTRVCSLYLTIYDDHFEVRYRDHGAGSWVAFGPDLNNQKRVFNVSR